MLEMLNPTALDVFRFATDTVRFRLEYTLVRRRGTEEAANWLAQRFCEPPVEARRDPNLDRLENDARRFFGLSRRAWLEQETQVKSVLEDAQQRDETYLEERVRCYRWASASGQVRAPKILLSHGWEGYALNFLLLIDLARKAGFEVHAFDHFAHGASSGKKSGLPMSLELLKLVARDLGPLEVTVGHSLGAGAVAYASAHELIDTKRVVLLAPFFDTYQLTKMWSKLHLLSSEACALLQRGLEAESGLTIDDFLPANLGPKLKQPTLVVHDKRDLVTAYQDSVSLTQHAPRAMLHTARKLGHVGVLADRECMGRVVDFALSK
jgi:pimeloyl-ACP methyl ester carboxylesterase